MVSLNEPSPLLVMAPWEGSQCDRYPQSHFYTVEAQKTAVLAMTPLPAVGAPARAQCENSHTASLPLAGCGGRACVPGSVVPLPGVSSRLARPIEHSTQQHGSVCALSSTTLGPG